MDASELEAAYPRLEWKFPMNLGTAYSGLHIFSDNYRCTEVVTARPAHLH
jgi:hypothetical protein